MKRLLATIAAAIGFAMGTHAKTWDLTSSSGEYLTFLSNGARLADGDEVTGTWDSQGTIKIVDGATVTFRDFKVDPSGNVVECAGITCEGDATIELVGDNEVTGYHFDHPAIFVPPGKTLTIKGPGTLNAATLSTYNSHSGWNAGNAAAIGGGVNKPCGNIVIESGIVNAEAGYYGAGIGAGASGGHCGTITIKSGRITAKGGAGWAGNTGKIYGGGAAIGGAYMGNCGAITIQDGVVTATGGYVAPGIGAGATGSSCGTITISAGTIKATGNGTSPGIGSGSGYCGNITFSGGTIIAKGGDGAPGIGSGANGSCASITITKGVESVCALPGKDCENPIGAGVNGNCSSIDVASELPSVTSGLTRIIGAVVDLGLLGGEEATIPDGVTLTGTLGGDCKISIADGATVTLDKVQIQGANDWRWAGLTCLGSATLNLSGTSFVKGFHEYCPGIYVPDGSTLTIQGDGILAASSNGGAAGIGGGKDSRYANCGNVVIKSGTVQAVGGDGAAGIGGGGSASGGKCGSITIKSGVTRVSATGGADAPNAIGAGKNGTGGALSLGAGLIRKDSTVDGKPKTVISAALRNLGEITSDTTFVNGEVLTGTLNGNIRRVKLTIADGATVTLSDAQIIGINTNTCKWAGLTCEGDATIILEGANGVQGFYEDFPGIYVPHGKTLTIKGEGSLLARSSIYNDPEGYGAAGIGGIYGRSSGNLVIEGGTIEAVGGGHAAGIGNACDYSASYCTNGYISILGGTVIARGGLKASGIGCGGGRSFCGDITIGPDVVSVTAIAGEGAPPIGKGFASASTCGTITVAEGLSDTTEGNTRTIRGGDLSKLTGNTVFGDGETLKGTLAGRYKVSIADGATVTLQDVVINGRKSTDSRWKWAGLTCEGDATIILAGDNTVKGFDYGYPGIYVPAGKTLTIKGTGSLAASSNDGAAGIGGGINACGNIAIEGGSIEATGSGAPGIGGGDSCGDITILGGSVKAKGSNAAGIGSDSAGECGTITISSNGGIAPVVEAVGGSTASGIGGAEGGYCGNIRIESGYVVATGGKFGSGIGGTMKDGCTVEITGGTVVATGGKGAPGIGHDGVWDPCGIITIGNGIDQVVATAGEGAVPIAGWDGSYETAPVLAPGLKLTTEGATSTIEPPTVAVYKVRYRKYDGSGETAEEFLECGKTYTLAWLGSQLGWSRPGYEFCGWVPWNPDTKPRLCKYVNGQPVKDLAAAGETIELYCGWKSSSSYRVCFHRCAGPDDLEKMNQVILRNKEDALAWMDSMIGWKREGYTFLGWDESEKASAVKYANGAKVQNLAMDGGTKHLYAVWRANADHKYPYKVKFYKYDGSGETRTQSFNAGTAQNLLWMDSQLGWSRPGYEFVGWVPWNPDTKPRLCKYVNGQKVVDLASKSGEVVSLYPAWKSSSSYRVCFNRNDGTGVKMNQVILRNKEDTLAWMDSQIGWKRDGYVFKGWAESEKGAVKYANGAKVKNLAMDGGTKHLYAIWRVAD